MCWARFALQCYNHGVKTTWYNFFFITLSICLIKFESQTKNRVVVKLGKQFLYPSLPLQIFRLNRIKLNIIKSLFHVLIDDNAKQKDKYDAFLLKVTVNFFDFTAA